ncbi:MAG: hypothetical protein AAFP23_09210 [Pseudomonadota bacterium]
MGLAGMVAGLTTLLLVQIPPGTSVVPLGNGLFFSDRGMERSLVIMDRTQAALRLDAAGREIGATLEDGVLFGYRSVLVRREAEGIERLYVDFGGDHIVLTSRPSPQPELGVLDAVAADEPAPALRDVFRPGSEAGRHPGTISVEIDGLSLTDAADRLPFDFFEGPLEVEIVPSRD